jgi:methionine-S-sulfoxide reductase
MAQYNGAQNKATLAGGCFWCIESAFKSKDGVIKAESGYMGGTKETAKYDLVASGTTKHREVVQVTFDPEKISYEEILEEYWQNIDPTQPDGQFADKGPQYRTAIFYHSEEQKEIAIKSKQKIQEKFKDPVVVEILPALEFFRAEDYHQDYSKKNPEHYKMYIEGSGRKRFMREVWGRK